MISEDCFNAGMLILASLSVCLLIFYLIYQAVAA